MSESLRNDGRVWTPKKQADKRPAHEIPDDERDYYLERKYPSFGNLAPRDIASRAAKEACDKGLGIGETGLGVYLDFRDAIAENGIRNALLTSIAPTGTISLYAGNVSSGIEPVFAYAYTRKVLQKDGSRTEEEVVDYAVQMWRDLKGDAPLPDYFVNAQTLAPLDHVKMQAAAQKWVDSSISKTINCPEDISFDAFKDVYMAAWDQGCKGCTTYRPNDVTGSVLSVSETTEKAPGEAPAKDGTGAGADVIYMSEPLDRPQALEQRFRSRPKRRTRAKEQRRQLAGASPFFVLTRLIDWLYPSHIH